MKIDNVKEISKVFGSVIVKSSTMPIIQCIKITVKGSKILFTGTNLNQTLIYTIDNLSNEPDLEMAVDFQEFKKLPDNVEVSCDENFATFKSGKTRIKLPLHKADLFPIIPDVAVNDGRTFILTDEIKKTFKTVSMAVQKGQNNSVFSGILLAKDIVATDTKRIYAGKGYEDLEGDEQWVIPEVAISLIDQFDEMSIDNKKVEFRTDNWRFVSSLITTKFPSYNKIFPSSLPDWFKVTDEVISAVKLAGSYIPKDSFKIMLETSGNKLTIKTEKDESRFITEVEVESYADKNIAFNQKFFLELCEVFNGEILGADSEKNPVIIQKNNNKGLLMPLRISR